MGQTASRDDEESCNEWEVAQSAVAQSAFEVHGGCQAKDMASGCRFYSDLALWGMLAGDCSEFENEGCRLFGSVEGPGTVGSAAVPSATALENKPNISARAAARMDAAADAKARAEARADAAAAVKVRAAARAEAVVAAKAQAEARASARVVLEAAYGAAVAAADAQASVELETPSPVPARATRASFLDKMCGRQRSKLDVDRAAGGSKLSGDCNAVRVSQDCKAAFETALAASEIGSDHTGKSNILEIISRLVMQEKLLAVGFGMHRASCLTRERTDSIAACVVFLLQDQMALISTAPPAVCVQPSATETRFLSFQQNSEQGVVEQGETEGNEEKAEQPTESPTGEDDAAPDDSARRTLSRPTGRENPTPLEDEQFRPVGLVRTEARSVQEEVGEIEGCAENVSATAQPAAAPADSVDLAPDAPRTISRTADWGIEPPTKHPTSPSNRPTKNFRADVVDEPVRGGTPRPTTTGGSSTCTCIVSAKKTSRTARRLQSYGWDCQEIMVFNDTVRTLLPVLALGAKVLAKEKPAQEEPKEPEPPRPILVAGRLRYPAPIKNSPLDSDDGVPLSVFLDDYLLPAAQALGVTVALPVPLRRLAKEGEKLGWLRIVATEVFPPFARESDSDPDPDASLVELLLEDLRVSRRGLAADLAQREAEVKRTSHRAVEKLGQKEKKPYGANRQLVLMDAMRARAEAAVARRWDGAEGRVLTALEKQFVSEMEAEREAEDAMGREWWEGLGGFQFCRG